METILFIIIAGILSTIFGKAKRQGQPKGAKSIKTKDFHGIRSMLEQPQKNSRKEIGEITTGLPVKSSSPKFEEKYQPIKKDIEINPVGKIYPQSKGKLEEEQVFTHEQDEKTIINGIIWAEILGPPRAKRPFSNKR
ncbi:hypothetical protein ACWM35_06140 [Neobacillus sp. K501]